MRPRAHRSPLVIAVCLWAAVVVAAWVAITVGIDDKHADFTSLWPPTHNAYFNALYATLGIPLVIIASVRAASAFGARTLIGRASLLFGAGLTSWAVGNTVWFWYTSCAEWEQVAPALGCRRSIEVPYPSAADVGFLILLPLFAVALLSMWRAAGVDRSDVVRLSWIPAAIAVITGYLLLPPFDVGPVHVPNRSWLFEPGYTSTQQAFSTAYSLGDVVICSLALILLVAAREVQGGKLLPPLLAVALACVTFYSADLVFDHRVATSAYYNGDISDLLYFLAILQMIVALMLFARAHRALQQLVLDDFEAFDTLGDEHAASGSEPAS